MKSNSAGSTMAVSVIDDDRFWIRGAYAGSSELGAVVEWLEQRVEIVDMSWRDRASALEVRHSARNGEAGALFRSLEDHLFSLRRRPTQRFGADVVHVLDGRVRVRLTGASEEDTLRIATWVSERRGVLRVSPSPATTSLAIVFDEHLTSAAALVEAIDASRPAEWPELPAPPPRAQGVPNAVFSTAVAAACATAIAPTPVLSVGVALSAIPSLRRAWRAVRERRVSVDLLDVAAIGISIATGQPGTGALITSLLSVGDVLLEKSADRARAAISKVVNLDARDAFRIEGDIDDDSPRIERVPASALQPGDRIVVDAGRQVAADGSVVSGEALVDEKALTGESEPRACAPGDRVLAATVVTEGRIVIEVERVGSETTAARIVQILEGAGRKPMTFQRDAERVTDRLVLPTFGIAGAAFAATSQLDRLTSVLITDFGTGIRVALPTSALVSMTLAARRGVLVKGAQYLERLARADVVVFDKTGTLTRGHPEVTRVTPVGLLEARELVGLLAGAEAQASHPIAEAIRRYASDLGVDIPQVALDSVTNVIGRGLVARVAGREVAVGSLRFLTERNVALDEATEPLAVARARRESSLLVAVDGVLAGVVDYADQPRAESARVVDALRAGGRRRIVLLSGDAQSTVDIVSSAVGITEAFGDLLPDDKARFVETCQREGKVVAMVGDGINDAPALALADVGISLHGSTDVALETADVVLLEGGLEKLVVAFEAGDTAMRNVKRGLGIVVVPNALAIVLGAMGLLTPGLAAVVNNGSTIVAALSAILPLLRSNDES